MKYTEQQIENWCTYERIREEGMFNMFDPRARNMTSMSSSEWAFCITHYDDLRLQATKESLARVLKAMGQKTVTN